MRVAMGQSLTASTPNLYASGHDVLASTNKEQCYPRYARLRFRGDAIEMARPSEDLAILRSHSSPR
jgi:hypothetical protein